MMLRPAHDGLWAGQGASVEAMVILRMELVQASFNYFETGATSALLS